MGCGTNATNVEIPAYAHLLNNSKPWWKNTRILVLNFWICTLLITSSTNGFDDGLQSLTQWETAFNYPAGPKLGLLGAIQNIGSLAAYPFSPYMTDGLGRRFSVLFGAAVMIAATASVQMFIGARFMIGFGLTFTASAAPLLVTELAYPSHRGVLTSPYNSLWLTYETFHVPNSWAWRIPSALQGLPSVIQICLVWFVPESPRWLVSKGRIMAYYHENGNDKNPLVEYEFEEIKEAIKFDREVSANVEWSSLFKTVGNRRRVRIITALAFFSQCPGNGLIASPATHLLVNGILNIWSLICALAGSALCDKVGRRPLFLTAISGRGGDAFNCLDSGMLIFWTLQTVCFAVDSIYHDINAGYAVVAMISFSPLIVSYTVGILPFALRAKGFTFFSFIVSLSLVYVFWICFEVVFLWFYLIETRNVR
ncbi:MFS general substrate transporter [Imleria badia]|nr:MFS general substrate transporter [Imleria badia]